MAIKMTTKERIIEEALTLFSNKGVKGTSVKKIAEAVGIKDSSIYKHFTSKQEILDAIVGQVSTRITSLSVTLGMNGEGNQQKEAKLFGSLSLQGLQELSRQFLLFYLQDEFISRFWRLAIMEQYHNVTFYDKYRHIFMEESLTYLTKVFSEMIKQKYFYETDPEVLAMNFYTPIFFMLSKYSGRPDHVQEALLILDKQVAEFHKCYFRK